jgi:hypothetical protein
MGKAGRAVRDRVEAARELTARWDAEAKAAAA